MSSAFQDTDQGTLKARPRLIDAEFLRQQAERVSSAIQSHAFRVLSPAQEKPSPTYTLTETAKLAGVSHATILRRADENPVYPKGVVEGNRRIYTLNDIHQIMNIEGTRPSRGDNPCFVLCTVNFKGGVTKSTTSVNTAEHLSEKGWRVALVDLDPQASSTSLMGLFADRDVDETQTISPLFFGEQNSLDYAVRPTYWSGLDLIPSNGWVASAETILPARQAKEGKDGFLFFNVLTKGLDSIKQNYDIIILDTPPSLGFITMNALWAADGLLIPCPASMLDVQSSSVLSTQLAVTIDHMNKHANEDKRYFFQEFLIPKYKGATTDDGPPNETGDKRRVANQTAMAHWIRQLYGHDCVMNAVMPETEAITTGTSIFRNLYELRTSEHKISRQTLKRGVDAARIVGDEIEELIKSCWAL